MARLKKIERVEIRGWRHGYSGGVEDLLRQAQLENVAALADGDDAQRTFLREAVHGDARGGAGNARGASEARHGKREAAARLEMRVAQQVIVDGALEQAERQARHEAVFDVATGLRHVDGQGFHGIFLSDIAPKCELRGAARRKEKAPSAPFGFAQGKER